MDMMLTSPVIMLLAMVAAAVISYLATPVVKVCACKYGAIDVPKDNRRMHKEPIPRMGGLAIFVAFAFSVFLFAEINLQVKTMMVGATIIVVLGIIDDKYALKAAPKFLIQIACAAIAVLGGNVVNVISNPNIFSDSPYWVLGGWSVPISIIWIVAITNAVNLIDGLDGLAVGVSSISSLTLLVIAMMMGNWSVAIMMGALFGACIGFLPYNKNPAEIFMGDTGSTFLGYVLAVLSIQGLFKLYSLISFVVPFLMLGLPIFDTAFAFTRRILHGQNPMKADRSHVHHRLIDMGLTQKQTVAVLYIISAILGVCAVVLTTSGALRALVILAALLAAGGFAAYIYLSTHPTNKPAAPEAPAAAEEAPAPAEEEPNK